MCRPKSRASQLHVIVRAASNSRISRMRTVTSLHIYLLLLATCSSVVHEALSFHVTSYAYGMELRQNLRAGAQVDHTVQSLRHGTMYPPPVLGGAVYSRLFVAGSSARPYCCIQSRLARVLIIRSRYSSFVSSSRREHFVDCLALYRVPGSLGRSSSALPAHHRRYEYRQLEGKITTTHRLPDRCCLPRN